VSKEYQRWQVVNAKNALTKRRVVVLTGARQSGKSTLLKQILTKDDVLLSLDNNNLLKSALEDPKGFVKNSSKSTVFIDEVQKAPALIPEIKMVVDKNNRCGQYMITGSANIQTLPIITDSLAGRNKRVRLRPLTVGEILNRKPLFLERAFNMNFKRKIPGFDKEHIFNFAFCGGYPEVIRLKNQKDRSEWYRDYIDDLINRDLKEIENIRRQDILKELILILAGWSGKYMDAAKIGSSLAISKPTLESYINALESLYIFERVNPWVRTDYDRIGKSPKLFAADTGIITSVLGWNKKEIMRDSDRSGKLMETFIFQELAAQVDLDSDYSLYQYRDHKQHEVDFLIERTDGAIIGIEVKSGHSVSKSDFAPQVWFKEKIIKNKVPYTGIILYSGEDTLSFNDGMYVVPIAALWAE
jgi:predicted AAA+ superfamily ATPase